MTTLRDLFSLLILLPPMSAAAAPVGAPFLACVRDGKPACTIVIISSSDGDWLMDRAASTLTDTIKRWSHADIPVVRWDERPAAMPDGAAIVLTTAEGLGLFAGSISGVEGA